MFSVGGMREFFNKFGNSCTLLILGIFAVSLVIGYSGNQGGRGGRGGNNGPNPADAVIATVNGQSLTEADFREAAARVTQQAGNATAGPSFAAVQGQAMQTLIQRTVIAQEAQRRNARPLEADIDKTIDQYRQSVATQQGKAKLGDQEWASYLETNRGMSVSDLREQAAKSLIPLALVNSLKGEEKVTENEARNQTAQAHIGLISVPYQQPGTPPQGKAVPLTEAEAQQKANALYAKIKAGADFATVARSNVDNPDEAKTGGDTKPIAEYAPASAAGGMSLSLPLLYGKDLADAVHKINPGLTTDVVKFSGFQHAYGFAKLIDRKVNTPKDFDPKKAIAALTTQRAEEKFETLVKSLVKSAKIEFKDPDKKTYYDYAKLESAGQEAYSAMLSGGPAPAPPTKAETDAQQAVIDKGFEDMLKRHPDDTTAAIMVADSIKRRKLEDAPSQDRLIALDETIAKSSDDFDRHFELADLYGKKKQYDKAKVHLDRVAKLLGYNTPYDLEGYQSADTTHRALEKKYRAINMIADADREKAASDALQPKIAVENMKQLEEQRKAKAAQSAQGAQSMPQFNIPTGGQATAPVTVPAGGSQAITITPTPDPSGGKAAPSPNTGIKITPTPGGATAPPPATSGVPATSGATTPPTGKGR